MLKFFIFSSMCFFFCYLKVAFSFACARVHWLNKQTLSLKLSLTPRFIDNRHHIQKISPVCNDCTLNLTKSAMVALQLVIVCISKKALSNAVRPKSCTSLFEARVTCDTGHAVHTPTCFYHLQGSLCGQL